MAHEPNTLQEAIVYFSDPANCHRYVVAGRWPKGVTCPTCGTEKVKFSEKHNRWQCGSHHPMRQFTFKTGTIFEGSPLGLDKWLVAMWLIANCKNGISSYEIGRALGITQKTAWFVLHRVRHAMHVGSFKKFSGTIESDETFIGGKAKNMHLSRRKAKIHGTGGMGKAIVHGILERGGKVRAKAVPNVRRKTLLPNIIEAVQPGSHVYTDEHKAYESLGERFIHKVINHTKAYVEGAVHTNGMENFWSLLKRAIGGTYVSVDAPHLGRYVDEEVFRFNERELNDAGRFHTVVPQIVGKRLTYKNLIGKEAN